MQHCSISVTLTYTDVRCVRKLVRPWQFTAAICFYILLTQLTCVNCRASTVSGKSRFRCEVMIWRALNACLIVANNESCLNDILPVNMQVGHGCKCIDPWPIWPIQKTDPFDPVTHRPIVYSAVLRAKSWPKCRSWVRCAVEHRTIPAAEYVRSLTASF